MIMLYILKLGCDHRMVVDMIKHNKKDVMIRELKTDYVFVITWKAFMALYEELHYNCDHDHDDHGSRFGELLDEL
jgi:hypothetical protein